ncbi:IST1 homolog isoform X2 [Watersipora subatra]|uniref:IST1 homolog isoform X2 n=1 Tax=Watersipora subatra TaxID=2589382 RepID=UPI00355B9100
MMFSAKCNYPKLKTNLRLTVNRLKLLEKKKTELALKSRKEIADYIQAGKEDRARIRVEHVVREDYMVEGMEILEMFCDMLLARFGIIERVNAMDPSIEEAVASIIWTEPRLSADIPELLIISKNLMARYGKEYHAACKANTLNVVNDKLMRKLSIYSPPKMLVENYMVEIAKSFNVAFQPDPLLLLGEDGGVPLDDLIGLGVDYKLPPPNGGSGGHGYPPPGGNSGGYPPPSGGYPPPGGSGGGGMAYPAGSPASASGSGPFSPVGGVAVLPTNPPGPSGASAYPYNQGFTSPGVGQAPPVPSMAPVGSIPGQPGQPAQGGFNIPPENGGHPAGPTQSVTSPPTYSEKSHPPNYSSLNVRNNLSSEPDGDIPSLPEIPGDGLNLPSVPSSANPGASPRAPGAGDPTTPGDIDFDDLAARFEKLKKKK